MSQNLPIEMIEAERSRQIEVKGWTLEHDDGHTDHQLAMYAGLLAIPASHRSLALRRLLFPTSAWLAGAIKDPSDEDERLQELAKAGALIVAEMERIQRSKR